MNIKTTVEKGDFDSYTDLIYDADGKGHATTISYEFFERGRSIHITRLEVLTRLRDEYLEESILENIKLRERKNIVLETKMELL